MSQWTHVNASIRFDGVMNMALPTENELGKICKWKDKDISHSDNPDLPCGSEGSIDYKIIKNPDKNCMAAMVVVFFGDLRDYNNADEILKYFKRVTKGKMIRSGVLEIDVEFKDPLVYRYDLKNNEWVKCY